MYASSVQDAVKAVASLTAHPVQPVGVP